jgi:uncharacterized protein (TIGR02145 family)
MKNLKFLFLFCLFFSQQTAVHAQLFGGLIKSQARHATIADLTVAANPTYQGKSVIGTTGIGYNGEAVPAGSTITVQLTNSATGQQNYVLSATDAGTGLIYAATGTIAASTTIAVILTPNTVVMPAISSGVITMTLTGANNTINLEPRIDIKSISASATQVTDVIYGTQTWMDRNLGARRVATATNDVFSYGNYYQWGRPADGHEIMVWNGTTKNSGRGLAETTPTLASDDTPEHANFITNSTDPNNWLATPAASGVNTLWAVASQGPCPAGYHVATRVEWDLADDYNDGPATSSGETTGMDSNIEAYASDLKLPTSGHRVRQDGSFATLGTENKYWTSTVFGTNAHSFRTNVSVAKTSFSRRANGFIVRCLKN